MTAAIVIGLDVVSVVLSIYGANARGQSPYLWLVSAAGAFAALVGALITRMWPWAAVDAAVMLFMLWMWWRNRRGKGRARALLSGKYRHVRDAMVRTLRHRRAARPVLAPGRA